MIGADLLRFDRQRKYLAYDFETEGLNLGYARPWQLSYCLFTLDEVLEEHDHFILWDDLKVSKGAAQITRFNDAAYRYKAMDAEVVLTSFERLLMDESVYSVAQNQLGYDTMIHAVWRRQLGRPEDYSYLPRAFDTVAFARAWKKGFKVDRSNLLAWQYRMMDFRERGLKVSLGQLGRDLEVPFDESKLHDALADIRLLREVWKKLLWVVEL